MPTTNVQDAIRFVTWLGQASPALYTIGADPWPAYRSDGRTTLQQILDERVNTYFSPAIPKEGLTKKAKKEELVCTQFLHVDMDPIDGNDPVKELDRLLLMVTDQRPKHVPAPSCIISSGRGIQALWRLDREYDLPEHLEAIESRNLWLMDKLQAPAGTHNVDRILRLPGSWNALDKKKIAKGYQPRQAELIEINNNVYRLESFEEYVAPKLTKSTTHGGSADDITADAIRVGSLDKLTELKVPLRVIWLVSYGTPGANLSEYERDFGDIGDRDPNDRSAWLYDAICQLLRFNVPHDFILGLLTDSSWGISAHCLDQKDPERAARRQLARAIKTVEQDKQRIDGDIPVAGPGLGAPVPGANSTEVSSTSVSADPLVDKATDADAPELCEDFIRDPKSQIPLRISKNVRIALRKFGIKLSHNLFNDALLMNDVVLQDPEVNALRFRIEEEFGWLHGKDNFSDLIQDEARKYPFHPVLDYLKTLVWDGKPRLDTWLIEYGGAADTPYTRAVGRLPLIAAVRRVREPGCEFQEILTLISAKQGTFKSTALQTLCPHKDWFTDDLPLNAESQQVIERLKGHWIVECAETKGMKRGGDEHVKAFLSRKVDKARMAYGRIVMQYFRQCVFIATSNDESFLRDPTGNRRWWPVIIQFFDITALAQDRDQLWAEAVHREAAGESIRLDPKLYEDAGRAQAAVTQEHPYVDILARALGSMWGKILAADVWDLVGYNAPRTQDNATQVRHAMEKLGWVKTKLRFQGVPQWCFVKDFVDENNAKHPGGNGMQILVSKRDDGRPIAAYEDTGQRDQAF